MKPSITWLLMGIGSGLVVGGSIRLAIELRPPILARYSETTSERELGVTALLFIVVGLPLLAVAFVIGMRAAAPFLADIRAQNPTPPRRPPRQTQTRWATLHLVTVAVVASLCVALLLGPVAAVIAVGCGVAVRMALTLAAALTPE